MIWPVLGLALTLDYRAKFPLPGLRVPDGWGVNIHFTDPAPGDVEKIATAGFRWVRMDFMWHRIETRPGVYDFRAYDRLLASLQPHGIRPILILDYGNDLFEKGSPRSPAARAAFCRFAAAAVRHFRGRGVVWEMWNEPNIQFWLPKPDVAQYIALAGQVGATIRREAPDEWFIGPATSGFDWRFLENCFRAGLLRYWDAVSIHPYRNEEPETVADDWAKLRSLIDDYRPNNRAVAMISGEWGYSELYPGLSREKQAAYAPRQYLANLASGVGLSIWYDWKDDGADPKEPEHHFGVCFADLKPKDAYLNCQAFAERLKGFEFAGVGPTHTVFRRGLDVAGVAVNGLTVTIDETTIQKGSIERSQCPIYAHAELRAIPTSFDVAGRRSLHEFLAASAGGGRVALRDPETKRPLDVAQVETSMEFDLRPRVVEVRLGGLEFDFQPLRLVNRHVGRFEIQERDGGLVAVTTDPKVQVEPRKPVPFPGPTATVRTRFVALKDGRVKFSGSAEARRFAPTMTSPRPELDGDAKVAATVDAKFAAWDGKPAQVIDYDFSPGWKFMNIRLNDARSLDGRPATFGVWVYGDGSGHLLRMRYTDATGQTFQPDYGPVDWKGWRWTSFAMNGSGGRWGGANDGVVHYPIRIESTIVFDSAGGRGGRGRIAVGPGLIYRLDAPQ